MTLGFALIPQALAQNSPQNTTATYGLWTVRCSMSNMEQNNGEPEKICEMAQIVRVKETGRVLVEMALGRLNKSDPVSLIFQVPPGVWLRSGIDLNFGDEIMEQPEFSATYFRCGVQSCLADGQIDIEFTAQLLERRGIIVSFVDSLRNVISVPISLEGFRDAYFVTFPELAE